MAEKILKNKTSLIFDFYQPHVFHALHPEKMIYLTWHKIAQHVLFRLGQAQATGMTLASFYGIDM